MIEQLKKLTKTPEIYDETFVNVNLGKYDGSLLGRICRSQIYGVDSEFFQPYKGEEGSSPTGETYMIRRGERDFSGSDIKYIPLDSPLLMVYMLLLSEQYNTLLAEKKETIRQAEKRQRRMELRHEKAEDNAKEKYIKFYGSADKFIRASFEEEVHAIRERYLFIDLVKVLQSYFDKGYRLIANYHLFFSTEKEREYKNIHFLLVHKDNTRRFVSITDSKDGESSLRVHSGYFGNYNTGKFDSDNSYRTTSVCSITQNHIGSQKKLFDSLIDEHVKHEDDFYERILSISKDLLVHAKKDRKLMKVLIQKLADVAFSDKDYKLDFVERLINNRLYSKHPTTLVEMIDALYKGREAVHSGGFAGYLEELVQEARDEALTRKNEEGLSDEEYEKILKKMLEQKKKSYSSVKKGYYAFFNAKWKKRSAGNMKKVDGEILQVLENFTDFLNTTK